MMMLMMMIMMMRIMVVVVVVGPPPCLTGEGLGWGCFRVDGWPYDLRDVGHPLLMT